jgi:hypothetical protein
VPVGRQPAVPSVRPGVPQIGQVLDIIRGARCVRRRTIKGELYHVALYTDASGKDMHFIFGSGSWTTAPKDEPLRELNLWRAFRKFTHKKYIFYMNTTTKTPLLSTK